MKKWSLEFIGFLQAVGIVGYCTLVSMVFTFAEKWIGPKPGMFGPVMFLSLLAVSVVSCALIFFGYPYLLFWEHKKTKEALRLVIYSTAWLAGIVVLGFALIALTARL